MPKPRAEVAAVLWIVAVVAGAPDVWTILGLLTIALGFLSSAGGERSGRTVLVSTGILVVAIGIVMFYRWDLRSGIYHLAEFLLLAGAAVAALGAWRDSVLPQQVGPIAAAVAGLIRVYADIGSWWWQPGNVLMVLACATATWGTDGGVSGALIIHHETGAPLGIATHALPPTGMTHGKLICSVIDEIWRRGFDLRPVTMPHYTQVPGNLPPVHPGGELFGPNTEYDLYCNWVEEKWGRPVWLY